jgi:lysophospholipase L1-like esterase
MITITKVGALVKIDGIEGHDNVYESISNFQGARMSADGTQLSLQIGEVNIGFKDLSNFTIGGTVPTNAATVKTALEAVFPSAAPATALPTEYPATYAAMQASITSDPTTKRDFFVSADETNGGGKTLYRYNGSTVKRLVDSDAIETDTTLASVNNYKVPSVAAIKNYIDSLMQGATFSKVVAASNTKVSYTGSTTETTVLTFTIPANSIGINGRFDIPILATATNNANNKTIVVRFNGVGVYQQVLTSVASYRGLGMIFNRGSLTSQVSGPLNTGASIGFGSNGASSLAPSTFTINTGADITVTVSILLANAADTASVEAFQVVAINPSTVAGNITSYGRIVAFGDSITQQTDNWTTTFKGLIPNSAFTNMAISGAKIAWRAGTIETTTPPSGSDDNNCLWNQIKKWEATTPATPSSIIIAIGTNDISQASTIGTMSDASAQDLASTSQLTMANALRKALQYLMTNYPNTQLFWCTPLQSKSGGRSWTALKNVTDVGTDVCKRLDVKVIDCFNQSGICDEYETSDATAGRYLVDGTHPSAAGAAVHGKFIAKEIAKLYIP